MIACFLILLLLRKTSCEDIVSTEKKHNVQQEKTDKHTANVDLSYRRFHEDTADREWHVSHLKDTDFSRRSECSDDTLADKIKKYRKSLRNDGGRVEYVFAEALPFDEADLLNTKTCPLSNTTELFIAPKSTKDRAKDKDGLHKEPIIELQKINDTRKGNDTSFGVDTATTAAGTTVQNKTAQEKSRRASEYQFSSIEYYDEITEFDDNMCPGILEVITLEIDQLRTYDVECEQIIEWKSLDNS